MASLSDVSRYLRQRRAIGKPITAADRSAAWNAYFDTEATKSLSRSRLSLDRRKTDIYEKNAADELAMRREAYEDQADAAKIQGYTQVGILGSMAYDKFGGTGLGGKALSGIKSLFGGGTSAAPVSTMGVSGASIPAADVAALSNVGAQGAAVTSLAPTTTMGVSGASIPAADSAALSSTAGGGAGGMGALGVGAGIATAVAADELFARNLAGTMDDPQKAWEMNTRGLRYGGASPGQTALLEKVLGEKGTDILDKITDPTGLIGKVEEKVGKYIAPTIPKFLGGGGSTGNSTVDFLLNPLGTWLCTETKKQVGFTKDEWNGIAQFREYAKENHSDWLGWYVNIGPELLKEINGSEIFYTNLKHTFLLPVINMTDGGFKEAAYLAYKEIVIHLVNKYKPELLESAPEVA